MENADLKNETHTCRNTVFPAIFCREEEKLIAGYMGESAIGGYHQSWDWLMPVVVKINEKFVIESNMTNQKQYDIVSEKNGAKWVVNLLKEQKQDKG